MKKLTALFLSLVLVLALLPGRVHSVSGEPAEQFYYGCSRFTEANERKASLALADAAAAGEEIVELRSYGISREQFREILYRFRYDHPELYDLEGSIRYSYTTDNMVHSVYLSYKTGMDKEAFRREAEKLLQLTWGKTTDYEKALVLHDALVRGVVYDGNAPHAHNAYGAIVEGRAVCEGYAKAYQYLLQQLGIQSFIATSKTHAWNLVRLDGKYYYTDVTWDDPLMSIPEESKPIRYDYFNIPESEIAVDDSHTFLPEYNAIKPTANHTDMKYRGDAEQIKSHYDFARILSIGAEGVDVKLSSRLLRGQSVIAAAYSEQGQMQASGVSAVGGSGEVERVHIPGTGFTGADAVRLFILNPDGVPADLPLVA